MRALFHALAAVGVLAVAAPASALTVQPASTTAAAPVVHAMFSDPVSRIEGAGTRFGAAVVGDRAGVSGLPVYFEPTQPGLEADEERYAADPVRFMARVDGGEPATSAAQAGEPLAAPKPPQNGR